MFGARQNGFTSFIHRCIYRAILVTKIRTIFYYTDYSDRALTNIAEREYASNTR